MTNNKKRLLIIAASFFLIHSSFILAKGKFPLIWDMIRLEEIKKGGLCNNKVEELVISANRYCSEIPVSVTDNERLFEPDIHCYCSMGQYWWPDSSQVGKYINKDGEINPESRKYDIVKLEELSKRSRILSQAYYITDDRKYYDAFLKQLYTWFIDSETYMAPNFEYAQVVPGYFNNKGRSSGMIDAYFFNDVIEGIRLVDTKRRINKRTMKHLQRWFFEFADWSESTYGETMRKGRQNISLAYDVMLVNMFLFAGEEKRAKSIADKFATKRILEQIKEDGSQPEELCRSKSFSYSIYNLTHIIDFCYLARYWDQGYYLKYGDRVDKAIVFLLKYLDQPDKFPFQQITSWDNCAKSLNEQIERRDRLTSPN